MDFIRQLEVFDPDTFNIPVHVIGAGATGSWVTLILAKMGVKNITVWDFDKVESHNLPNQAFSVDKVGESKVYALHEDVEIMTDISIKTKYEKVDGSQRLSGIVFMLTDTMSSRKEIYEEAIQYNPAVKLLIETRMDLTGGRIYAIDPSNVNHIKEYVKEFYSDEEASVSACGASQSLGATAIAIASQAVWQLINYHNDTEINNEILVDYQYNNLFTRKF